VGHLHDIDGTTVEAKTNTAWSTSDYTVLNILHAAIGEDVADMILAGDQTARQLWLAARNLFSANKANKAIYLDNEFQQLLQGASTPPLRMTPPSPIARSSSTPSLGSAPGLPPPPRTEPLPTFLRARGCSDPTYYQDSNMQVFDIL
jgi:hypothetical protein